MAEPGITDPQRKYLSDLVERRDMSGLSESQQTFLSTPDAWSAMTMDQASKAIKKLLSCPWKTAASDSPVQGLEPGTGVPDAGYYFIVDPTNKTSEYPEGKESFFKVTKGKNRWEGYTFLSAQASDDWYPIKDAARRQEIFNTILIDPIKAMNEYGIKLGVCGSCGRTLTDKHSRLQGLGPVCAERILSIPTEEDLNILNQLGLLG